MWFKEYSYDETNACQDLKEIYTSHDDNNIYRSVTNLEEFTMNTSFEILNKQSNKISP